MSAKFSVNLWKQDTTNTAIVTYTVRRKSFTKSKFSFFRYGIIFQSCLDILTGVLPISLVEVRQMSFEKRNIVSAFFNVVYGHGMVR